MIKIDVVGTGELSRALARLTELSDREARRVVAEVAYEIEADAKELCPVDTGRLRSSITTALAATYPGAEVGTNVEYAPYVEFGTYRQQAQPYLTPAAETNRETLRRRIEEAMRRLH